MYIFVNNFCKSGLGDRMMDLICLITYSYINKCELIVYSENFTGVGDNSVYIPEWRFKDTLPENLLTFFNLPVTFTNDNALVNRNNKTYLFPEYLGGVFSPSKFFNKYLRNNISIETFREGLNYTKGAIGLKHSIDYHDKYVVVHLRRTDKLRGVDSTQMRPYMVDKYNADTIALIEASIAKGYKNFYLASDCSNTLKEYEIILTKLNVNCINDQIKNENNLIESYFDILIMSKCDFIIVSSVYSNFSLFCALLFNRELWVLDKSVYIQHGFDKDVVIRNLSEIISK